MRKTNHKQRMTELNSHLTEVPPAHESGVAFYEPIAHKGLVCIPYSRLVREEIVIGNRTDGQFGGKLKSGTVRIVYNSTETEDSDGIEDILPEDQPKAPRWTKSGNYRYLGLT